METNLDSIFKTNKKDETEGKWIELAPGAEFKIKRFGGHNSTKVAKIRETLMRPYARQLQNGNMDSKVQEEIGLLVFIKSCLVDWKGICDQEDKDVAFTEDNALALLKRLPDLHDILLNETMNKDNFKGDLGNF